MRMNKRSCALAFALGATFYTGAYAEALTPGNLVVGNFYFGMLTEVQTTQSAEVDAVQYLGAQAVADPAVDKALRGVTQADDGNLYLYRGSTTGAIQQLNPVTGAVTDISIQGFGTHSGYTYGDIAAYKNLVFATDMDSTGLPQDAPNGLIQYRTDNGAVTRFGLGHDYTNLTVGLNGFLYAKALGQQVLDVYDPVSTIQIGSVQLSTSAQLNSFVVDAQGKIFASSFDSNVALSQILSFDANGQQQLSSSFSLPLVTDLAINDQGQIAIASVRGKAWMTDTSLTNLQPFATLLPDSTSLAFVREISAVPEVSSMSQLVVGLCGLMFARRRVGREKTKR